MNIHLPILSNSEMRSFRRCPREHEIAYLLSIRPVRQADPLRFGSLIHLGLEAWWRAKQTGSDALAAALAAVRADESDPFELVKAEALLVGYDARWGNDDEFEILSVEAEFSAPLVNPQTGAASKTFRLGGKIDVIVRKRSDGTVWIVEHKSSAEDVVAGSSYWKKLRLDSQVSTYFVGARALGHDVRGCIYDVLKKPTARPLKATPVEAREYTKPKDKACPECKKKSAAPAPHTDEDGRACENGRIVTDPGGKLYANMRESDETVEDYRARVLADMAERPEHYFVRGDVVRLSDEESAAAADAWMIARSIREAELLGRHPKNVDSCIRYNRECEYFAVCSGEASLDDPLRYRVAERKHEELEATHAA